MVALSIEFKGLTSKIYTFSFLCLTSKLLEITTISQAGVRIEVSNTELVAGAFGIVAALLTTSAVFRLLNDFVRTRVAEEVREDEVVNITPSGLIPSTNIRPRFTESSTTLIHLSGAISFAIEAIVPLIVGVLTSWYAAHDMVSFAREVTT